MSGYIFDDAAAAAELERLRALEAVFDPASERLLSTIGEWAGRRCLEVGAGAGSIARFMQRRAGSGGQVTAVDLNTRFLAGLEPGIQVVQGDLRELALDGHFDVVHARYVLIHNADAGAVLDALVQRLAPGAWLLLEEPDFRAGTALAGPPERVAAFERIVRAIELTFEQRGMDPGFGRRLPALTAARGLELVAVENEPALERGGAPLARMMTLSARQLADKYIATGQVSQSDVDAYCAFAADPSCWGIYYATVRVLARRARS